METSVIAYEGKNFKLTKGEYDTFVSSISTQNPTPEEIKLHLWYCDSKNVHVLDKLIYFTKRKGRYVPVVGIDLMRIRAESSGAYAGSDDAVFDNGDGKTKYPISATVAVYKMVQGRLGRFTATARWAEYAPEDLQASAAFLWRKMPHTMLAKCAEALALRKAFPGQLNGFYAREELAQDGRYVEAEQDFNYNQELEKESPKSKEKKVVVVEAVSADQPVKDGYLPSEMLGNKKNQVADLVNLTGKTTQQICAFVSSLDKNTKYSLLEVQSMMESNEEKENK